MRDNAIEIKGVSKFVDGKPIVYRVNLEVPKGTLYGLLGPNGAGKSTTIKLLTGRIRPSSGKIRINGMDPWKDRVRVNSMIGYLPQNSIQYQEKTVIDFMVLMGKLIGKNKYDAKKDGRDILDQVGLGKFEDMKIGKLSGGEKQRLGFANALIGDPEILILDEPTASLDPAGRVYVMNLIKSLSEDDSKTVVISSHILPEIRRMTNHVAIMSEGSVLTSGNIHELTKDVYDKEYELRTNKPSDLLNILHNNNYSAYQEKDRIFIDEIHSLEEFWSILPKLCSEKGIEIRSMIPKRDSLETLFLDLVNKKQRQKEEINE